MDHQQMYFPYLNSNQQPYYPLPNYSHEIYNEIRNLEDEEFRPDDAEDAPTTPPPSHPPQLSAAFSGPPAQSGQMKIRMCNCLGRWGYLRLRRPGPFGRDFWFFPTEVRISGVSGYTWQAGRRRKVSYRYSQISHFMCST